MLHKKIEGQKTNDKEQQQKLLGPYYINTRRKTLKNTKIKSSYTKPLQDVNTTNNLNTNNNSSNHGSDEISVQKFEHGNNKSNTITRWVETNF